MTQRALIGTAFEYAGISSLSARISNDIQALLSLTPDGYISQEDVQSLAAIRDLMTNYHYKYSATQLDKHISEATF